VSILTEKFQLAKDSLSITHIEVGYDCKAYYDAYIDAWDKEYLVIKYLDATTQSSVIERTILINDITEFKMTRAINLEESFLKSDPESSPYLSAILFAEDFPSEESDNVMEEIFYDASGSINYGYYESSEDDDDDSQPIFA
jgi:hypothetical protein